VTKEALDTLHAYKRVSVIREYGQYKVSTGICLKSSYAPDYKAWDFTAEEQFTPAQRQLNYVAAFHDYPMGYTGKRDYNMLRELESWDELFVFDGEGNIVRA
jgi:hypothetical protein